MIKTVLEDESDILKKCSEMRLFDDEEDAAYASVSEADKSDLEHFDYFFLNWKWKSAGLIEIGCRLTILEYPFKQLKLWLHLKQK